MTIRSIVRLAFPMFLTIVSAVCCFGRDEAAIHVAHNDVGPRQLEPQTRASVVQDYLEAWRGMDSALEQNAPAILDAFFIGTAKTTLTNTIEQQKHLKIHTSYKDVSHNIKIVFYSPEGLSIQLVDDVECQVDVRNHDGTMGSHTVRARYVAVLTPTESRWKVRIFQSGAVT